MLCGAGRLYALIIGRAMRHTATRGHPSSRGKVATLELRFGWLFCTERSSREEMPSSPDQIPGLGGLRFHSITRDILVPELVVILDVRGGTHRI